MVGNSCSRKVHGGKQLLPEAVTGEGTRLAHQRADDVAVIDVGFTFTAHPFHAFTTQPRPHLAPAGQRNVPANSRQPVRERLSTSSPPISSLGPLQPPLTSLVTFLTGDIPDMIEQSVRYHASL